MQLEFYVLKPSALPVFQLALHPSAVEHSAYALPLLTPLVPLKPHCFTAALFKAFTYFVIFVSTPKTIKPRNRQTHVTQMKFIYLKNKSCINILRQN